MSTMQLRWGTTVPRSYLAAHAGTNKVSGRNRAVLYARKQAEQKEAPTITADDAVHHVLPADLDELKKLTKRELQHELDIRGLHQEGDKAQLASRLLDNLISQESAITIGNATSGAAASNGASADIGAATTVQGRRSRRTSRKATASVEPLADKPAAGAAADATVMPVANGDADAAAAVASTGRRGRRTSRRATAVVPEQPNAAVSLTSAASEAVQDQNLQQKDTLQQETVVSGNRHRASPGQKSAATDPTPVSSAATALETHSSDAVPADVDVKAPRRTRRSSRRTGVVESMQAETAPDDDITAPAGARTTGRKSSSAESVDATAEMTPDTDGVPVTSPRRARRSSRKSSVLEPAESAAVAAVTAAAEGSADTGARRSRGHSSARTSSKAPTGELPVAPPSSGSSRVKSLAQQLAKKALESGPAAVVAPVAAATSVVAAPKTETATAAQGNTPSVEYAEMLAFGQFYAGSQAQSDSILMEGKTSTENSYDNLTATYEEVIAQVSAERLAGLADEPQLVGSILVPEAEETQSSVAAEELVTFAQVEAPAAVQKTSLADIAAAMSEPAEASLGEDEEPDAALIAFDHMDMEACEPQPELKQVQQQQQQPSVLDISSAATEDFLDHVEVAAPLEEDEEADVALTAFDHLVLDPPATQPAEQHPNLADIAAAIANEPATAEGASPGEDEEVDDALNVFDHEQFAVAAGQTASLPVTEKPLEPSSEGDAAVAPTPVAVVSNSFASTSSGAQGGIPGLFKGWFAAVLKMFEEWQKALSQ